jgi:hypothetical protein
MDLCLPVLDGGQDQGYQLATVSLQALLASALTPEQARRQHTGVVEHQQIAFTQQLAEITEAAMCKLSVDTIHHQQTTGRPLGHRMRGNEFVG